MQKGTELAGKLLKINDIHPVLKDVIVQQQQDIFFLRKEQITMAQVIEDLVNNFATLVNANDAMLKQYKSIIGKTKNEMLNDERLSND